MAVNSRRFLARAVAWTAQQGIRQWLDLGGGMPTRGTVTWTTEHGHAETAAITPLHEAAQAAADDDPVSYVYVDLDPIAVSHAQLAAAAPQSAVRAVRADFVDTASVLRSPEVTGVLDFSRPADLILGMVLHFLPEDEASTVVASYARVLAPGSYVIVSIGRKSSGSSRPADWSWWSRGWCWPGRGGQAGPPPLSARSPRPGPPTRSASSPASPSPRVPSPRSRCRPGRACWVFARLPESTADRVLVGHARYRRARVVPRPVCVLRLR
jgi:S-adenosyl methyltransferase